METNEQLCVLAQNGDMTARNLLMENNLPFIQKMANSIIKQCSHNLIDADDLVQEGCFGLLETIDRFNTDREIKFLTYAVYWIRKYMWEIVNTYATPANTISLDDAIQDDEQTRGTGFFEDIYSRTPEQVVINAMMQEEIRNELQKITPRERIYLLYRYGFTDDKEHSIEETASHFFLTVKRAKKTEQSALNYLRRKVM